MRIPFDNVCVAAAVHELEEWVGAKVQKVGQQNAFDLTLEVYLRGKTCFRLSCDPDLYGIGQADRFPRKGEPPKGLAQAAKPYLEGATLVGVEQVDLDRILVLNFVGERGPCRLIAELLGKQSNLVLVREDGQVSSAARWLGEGPDRRVMGGRPYLLPPSQTPRSESELDGFSPFFKRLATEHPELPALVRQGRFQPSVSSSGAYPYTVGPESEPCESFLRAWESVRSQTSVVDRFKAQKASLRGLLEKLSQGRKRSLEGAKSALESGQDAGGSQQMGELILAYQGQIKPGDGSVDVWDYAGNPITIPLKPDLSAVENANRYFTKAKRAKERVPQLKEQVSRLELELYDLGKAIFDLDQAETEEAFQKLADLAAQRRWLQVQTGATKKEDRPYAGHRVSEMLGPKGYMVLVGINATANDYLSTKVGKGNDLWFHVRGHTSAHVLVLTGGKPEKVPQEVLRYAAELAAKNSPLKHSQHVPVDYTLKKYVRKPRGSAVGTVVYTNEKTLHVDP